MELSRPLKRTKSLLKMTILLKKETNILNKNFVSFQSKSNRKPIKWLERKPNLRYNENTVG